ncbi:MAG: RagB/SusD family nutrient uptake outer membrane protein [Bacteroidales bacterium]
MKKFINILIASIAVAGLSSCDDFLTREPVNEFSAETYFASESELKMFTDGMLNSWMPNPTETDSGDNYNDLIATKTSTDFFRGDVIWDDTKQGGWSWSFLRRCNYMLKYMSNAKGKVSDEVYNHYEGIARFWRAYIYFDRVKTFSNVPWTDKYLDSKDTAALFGPRDDREFVMHQIVEDLEFACTNVLGTSAYHTDGRARIDKYVVNAMASRIYLYEGTFRKNVANNPATGEPWNNKYETADQLIQLAANAANRVMVDDAFKLINNYSDLFLSTSLQKDEVIWGRTFLAALNGTHAYSRYFKSSTLGQQYSGTKDLVRMFLKTDGTPVLTGEQTINEEFNGRDPRLAVTVMGPGHNVKNLDGTTSPDVINCTFCMTGYMMVKWVVPDATHFQNSIDENSIPLIRYAEVLLNYAEAMNELGKMDETIWNETVGALRERAGVKNIYPGSSSYVKDEWLRKYYTTDVNHVPNLNDIALEIRRERVSELTYEGGLRQDDIYRYGQADLLERRYNHQGWTGIWLSDADANADAGGFAFTFEGTNYKIGTKVSKTTEYAYQISNNTDNRNWSLAKAEGSGYYLVYNYKLKWDDNSMYCRPIPATATTLNPALGQNHGW